MWLTSLGEEFNKLRCKYKSKTYLDTKRNITDGMHFFKESAIHNNVAIPWFIVLGKEQAGKTSLFKFSELHFPHIIMDSEYEQAERLQCNWWFNEKAVLLDLPSRYLQSDCKEWPLWLTILRKYHKPYPAHGILLLIKQQDFLTEISIEEYAKEIRRHIERVYKELRCILPVYIFITHMDRLIGFPEFFSDNQKRYQPWGIALSHEDGHWPKPLQQLEEIYIHLNRWLFARLQSEISLENRFRLLHLPKQYRAFIQSLAPFLKFFIHSNPYQITPNLAGIYFTGITDKCGYFMRDTLEQRIFASCQPVKPIKPWYNKSYLQIICIVVILLSFGLWLHSARQANIKFLQKVNQANTALYHSLTRNMRIFEPLWLNYRYRNQLIHNQTDVPYYLRLGLQPRQALLEKLNQFLLVGMQKEFLMPIADYLEHRLNNYSLSWPGLNNLEREKVRSDYYHSLKAYLSLCMQKPEDLPATISWLAERWNNLFQQKANLVNLKDLLNFYFSHAHPTLLLKSALIQTTRQQLSGGEVAYNLYLQLRELGIHQLGYLELNKWHLENNLWQQTYHLPRFYTASAWQTFVYPQIKRLAQGSYTDWVLTDPSASDKHPRIDKRQVAKTIAALRAYYFSDYRRAWLIWLQNLQLKRFGHLAEASKKISNLKTSLQLLLMRIAEEWTVTEPIEPNKPIHSVPELEDSAQELRRLLTPGHELWQAYWSSIDQLPNELNRLLANANPEIAAWQYANLLLANNSDAELYHVVLAADRIIAEISDVPTQQAFRHILLDPCRQAWHAILQMAASGIMQQWKNQVLGVYQQGLAYRFPFRERGSDATRDEIVTFLAPHNGVLWENTERLLSAFVQEAQPTWQERTWLGLGLNFNPDFLANLARAKRLSQAFFKHSLEPSLPLSVYFIPTPGVREIRLTISDNQNLRYRNGPQEWQRILWPINENDNLATLSIIEDQNGQQALVEEKGPWALLRLLQKAKISLESAGVIKACWRFKTSHKRNYTIYLLIRSDANALADLLINRWVMPANILLTKP